MGKTEVINDIKCRIFNIENELNAIKRLVAELEQLKPEVVEVEKVVEKVVEVEKILEVEEVDHKHVDARLISDLKRAIGLNDRIRFQKNLFDGDATLMSSTIEHLNTVSSYEDALSYLSEKFSWDDEDETVKYFKDILSRKAY